jgi:hypothetical protein
MFSIDCPALGGVADAEGKVRDPSLLDLTNLQQELGHEGGVDNERLSSINDGGGGEQDPEMNVIEGL